MFNSRVPLQNTALAIAQHQFLSQFPGGEEDSGVQFLYRHYKEWVVSASLHISLLFSRPHATCFSTHRILYAEPSISCSVTPICSTYLHLQKSKKITSPNYINLQFCGHYERYRATKPNNFLIYLWK